ncbi:MAG: hypothetical protein AB1714_04980 [Acidobacteriota bacterium]
MSRRPLVVLALVVLGLAGCATHRLETAKTHYVRAVELADRMDRGGAAAEFSRARDEAAKIAGSHAGDAQAWLIKGQAEIELGEFEEARRSFASARAAGADLGDGWERVAQLLGVASVYEAMEMPDDAAMLCETAMKTAKKECPEMFEPAAARWVNLLVAEDASSEDPKARAKQLAGLEKKVRDLVEETPGSGTLRYLLSQVEVHLEDFAEGWGQAVLARELGLPTEELLRDNDNSLLFCYRQLIESGRTEYDARQAAWAKRWGWPDATHAPWMAESK